MSELRIEGLSVAYGDVVAVHEIDLHVHDGEFVTLLGPSGCGKTTTLRCVAGLEPRAGGQIRIGDDIVSGPGREVAPEARNINMVFQTYAVWPHMSVRDNVAFGLKIRKLRRDEVRRRVDETLRLVGLADYADRYGTELSGGQQQRVALARAVVTEPRLLLFDEPLSNLDAALREQMRLELRELHERIGRTAVYVTHDQIEAMVMSDKVVLMRDGRIVQSGSPEDLYDRPRTRFAAEFMGTANIWDGSFLDRTASSSNLLVRLDDDLAVEIAPHTDAPLPASGDRGAVAVRSERIEVQPAAASTDGSGNRWRGTVERMAYLGSCVEYQIRVGDRIVRAEGTSRQGLATGDAVDVCLPPDAVMWLDDTPDVTNTDRSPVPAAT